MMTKEQISLEIKTKVDEKLKSLKEALKNIMTIRSQNVFGSRDILGRAVKVKDSTIERDNFGRLRKSSKVV